MDRVGARVGSAVGKVAGAAEAVAGRMFAKNLQDMIRGMRAAAMNGNEHAFVADCMQEIKTELRSRDVSLKASALQKLTFLHMHGYDVSWAAFHVTEVYTQERFGLKRIGAMMATQTFTDKTEEIIMLLTQQLKRDLSAPSMYQIGVSINCIANVATEGLARDIISDIVRMLASSKPYIRKKATLVLYKLYLKYPQGLRLTFDKLRGRLEDDDSSVVSCAVNVICELARKKPKNYVGLAPDLFRLLTSSNNNWMLIKVVKLMSSLVREEPRLARKLLEPLASTVQTTSAKSLQYECLHAITVCLLNTKRADGTDAKNAPAVIRLCTDKLRELIRDPDQNLKYLGLVGLANLMLSNPRVVAEHRDLVISCLDDEDVTIRIRALELITGMVTRRNLPDIVHKLLEHVDLAEGHYRDELVEKIIFMCSRDKYAYLSDFEWYIRVLVRLSHVPETAHGEVIAAQLVDVAVRVEEVRAFAVRSMLPILADVSTRAHDGRSDVLFAAAWIMGEFADLISPSMLSPLLDALLQPGVLGLSAYVQGSFVQCALKVLAAAARTSTAALADPDSDAADVGDVLGLARSVAERLRPFARSAHVEVQERAATTQQLLKGLGVTFDDGREAEHAAAEAAAKAKAAADKESKEDDEEEDDLLALAASPEEAERRKKEAEEAAAAAKKKAEAEEEAKARDVPAATPELLSRVLSALFDDPLRPVAGKAQKKVPVPDGLDLDSWISDAERKASKRAKKEERAPGFVYEAISFEDSYGVAESAGGAGGVTAAGGTVDYRTLRAEEDEDSAWWTALEKKKAAEGKAGAAASAGGAGSGGKKSDKDKKAAKKARQRSGDPFMLGGGGGDDDDDDDDLDRHADGIDLDAIPMHALSPGELNPAAGGLGSMGLPSSTSGGGKRKKFVVADEEEPEGAEDSDDGDEEEEDDELSKIDLTTPLGNNEHLPSQRHRVSGAKKDSKKKKKDSKKKKEKDKDKDKDKDSKKDKKDSKKKKKDKDKDKEKEKDPSSSSAAAAASSSSSSKDKGGSKPAASPPPASAVSALGEEAAHAPPRTHVLFEDKNLAVRYIIEAPASPPSEGARLEVVLLLRLENKSTKRTLEWVDLSVGGGIDLVREGMPVGASEGSVRLGTALEPRADKTAKPSVKRARLCVGVGAPLVGAIAAATVSYRTNKGKVSTSDPGDAMLNVGPGALLVPEEISADDYRGQMHSEIHQAMTHAEASAPIPSTGFPSLVETFAGAFRAFAVKVTSKHAIFWARAAANLPVTALLVRDAPDSKTATLTIKSAGPHDHATTLLADVMRFIDPSWTPPAPTPAETPTETPTETPAEDDGAAKGGGGAPSEEPTTTEEAPQDEQTPEKEEDQEEQAPQDDAEKPAEDEKEAAED